MITDIITETLLKWVESKLELGTFLLELTREAGENVESWNTSMSEWWTTHIAYQSVYTTALFFNLTRMHLLTHFRPWSLFIVKRPIKCGSERGKRTEKNRCDVRLQVKANDRCHVGPCEWPSGGGRLLPLYDVHGCVENSTSSVGDWRSKSERRHLGVL